MSAVTTATGKRVVTVRIDDGKANVMTPAVIHELGDAIAEAGESSAILLTGRPGCFVAGFDLKTLNGDPDGARQLVGDGVQILLRLLRHPRPVVIACTGHAIGYGAFLLLAADRRIGFSGEGRIGLPELSGGIAIPPMILSLVSRRLTPAGIDAILAAQTFTAAEAHAVGYLDAVDDDPLGAARTEADRLAQLDPGAFRRTKQALREPVVTAMLRTLEDDLRDLFNQPSP